MSEINKWPQDMVKINILLAKEVEINFVAYPQYPAVDKIPFHLLCEIK